jgi:hypothetical protein
VTDNHVVSDCVGDIHGNLTNENAVKLRIVSADETNDLALLQAPKRFIASAVMRETAVHSGDSIIAIGYPFHGLLTSAFTVTTGIISSRSGIFKSAHPFSRGTVEGRCSTRAVTSLGPSPPKNKCNEICKDYRRYSRKCQLCDQTGSNAWFSISYQAAESGAELKAAEIANKARAHTMLISCSANVTEADKKMI